MLVSGAASQMEMNRDYYFNLRDRMKFYPNPCFNQVELDLRRTFPNEPQDSIEKFVIPLRNVLSCFVKRNPTIGYCQGMNFIAGNILKHCNEQQSFWLFVTITENILPLDYYSDLLGVLIDQKIFEEILTERYPKLVAHMQKLNYQLDMIAFQWLVTLFFNCLQHDVEMFVLTAFLIKGPKIIIKVALFIVEHFKAKVMRARAFEEIYSIFAKDPMEEISCTVLSKMFRENKKFKVTNTMLMQKRDEWRPRIIEGLQESFSSEALLRNNTGDKRLKFLNQFYLFNGFNKFIEYQVREG